VSITIRYYLVKSKCFKTMKDLRNYFYMGIINYITWNLINRKYLYIYWISLFIEKINC